MPKRETRRYANKTGKPATHSENKVREAAKLAIKLHKEALKELERH